MKSFTKISKRTLQTCVEIALIFAVFAVFGGWPIPDSNEAHYIGKAIHFWNPDWIPNDDFLQSKDAHWTFYVTFGWLSFFCSPYWMAWLGRAVTWLLLAWSWRRLSYALLPIRWLAIPTALVLACYVDTFHMAGEWIVGGVEGKSFAFPFVFFGLEAMIRGRWHRTWIFLGIASAFHVLVGGWAVLVAGMVWATEWKIGNGKLAMGRAQASHSEGLRNSEYSILHSQLRLPWGLFLGGAISLCGLVPAVLLDHGTPVEIVREAHQIYVFERVSHHLMPFMFPWTFVARFLVLTGIWVWMCRFFPGGSLRHKRFDAFIWGTLLLSVIGFIAAYVLRAHRTLAAEILRFYWFRLSDIAVPMGVALGGYWNMLLALRKLRKEWWQWQPPRLPGWIALCGAPFALYLLLDAFFFHNRLYTLEVAAEPAFPWALTILMCWGVWCVLQQYTSLPSGCYVVLYLPFLFYAPFETLADRGDVRTYHSFSRVEPGRPYTAYYWIDACHWISENTPKTAKFWVPKEGTTFKWHSRRSDVGTWKDVPQDAAGLLRWREMMRDLHWYRGEDGLFREDRSLTVLLWWKKPEEIEQLRKEHGFDHILCAKSPELPHLGNLETIYENEVYRVLRIKKPSE